MKVLLTGATGFLGSNLLKALLKKHYKVIALKRSFSDTKRISSVMSQATIYDLDRIQLVEIFSEHKDIDVIVHTATNYGRVDEKYTSLLTDNVLFPLELMEYSQSINVKGFLNTDSFFNKFYPMSYLGAYTLTKRHLNDWAKIVMKQERTKYINVKLEHIYGPMDSSNKFTKYVIDSFLNNKKELNLTEGIQKRDFVYVDDVVNAYMTIIDNIDSLEKQYLEFEVGVGLSVAVREFVETAHKLTKSKTKINFGAIPMRKDEIMESKADITALQGIGWIPKYNLWSGLRKTLILENNQ